MSQSMSVQTLKFPRGLYGVTPDWSDASRLEQAIREAAAGGMVAVQLRLKSVPTPARQVIAQRLREVCSELGIVYIINDDWRLALEIGADGVHLGKEDGDPAAVKAAVGDRLLIGVSCYADPARARAMLTVPVEYVAFGAMFASSTKPAAPTAARSVLSSGRELVTQAADKVGYPRAAVVAIGGITPENAPELVAAGADSLAVVGALFNAPDVRLAAQQFTRIFSGSR